MTSDTWSHPVLLVGPRKMTSIAAMVPANVKPELQAHMSWSRKLEETLVDHLPSMPGLKSGIEWFRDVINRTLPEYNGDHSPCVTKIIADLVSIDQGTQAAPSNLVAADITMHGDIFVQHFPGADLPPGLCW